MMMATLSRIFKWRDALVNVKPDTLIRWHRKGFRLFWRWKSKPTGRPRLPKDLRQLIREMAAENPTWGEERIANERPARRAASESNRGGLYEQYELHWPGHTQKEHQLLCAPGGRHDYAGGDDPGDA